MKALRTGRELAIDLGTANTLVFVRGRGIVVFEPSVVSIDDLNGNVEAVGEEARRMIGRTPATIRAIRPLRHGVITDFSVTAAMLRYFIGRVGGGGAFSRVVLCVPSGITKVERAAVEEATLAAGARVVSLIEDPMAAAIGAGLPVAEAQGSMVVDIGGGTTEVAVLALGGIVVWESIKVGGYEMDDAIVRHVDTQDRLLIGTETAEGAKIAAGSATPLDEALETTVASIIDAVVRTLETTPPELAADISSRGIVLAGGGSLLRGIDRRLADQTGVPVIHAEAPLECVALGAGASLEEADVVHGVRRRSALGRRVRRGGRRW